MRLRSGKTVKVTYEETYRDAWIRQESLPTLNHLTKGTKVIDAELLKAGTLADGTEIQVLRVFVKPVGGK